MRAISKNPEPLSLTVHCNKPHSNYDNYAAKDDLRHALAIEQRGLCCYCMRRIVPKRECMKIEHWRSQANYPKEQLQYRNLLGACLGGEGQPWHLQHCDTRKGDSQLEWNPANPAHRIETRIRYELDGSIRSDATDFDSQLNRALNLNLPFLKNQRKATLAAVSDWWMLQGALPRSRILRKRNEYVLNTKELPPYSQVAVQWLDEKLANMKT